MKKTRIIKLTRTQIIVAILFYTLMFFSMGIFIYLVSNERIKKSSSDVVQK